MTAVLAACPFTENPGRSLRTALVAARVDLDLRVAAAVVATGPALVAVLSSGLAAVLIS